MFWIWRWYTFERFLIENFHFNLFGNWDHMRFFELAASTHDQEVFSFYPDEAFCNGFEEVLRRYRELVPNLRLAGYNSFISSDFFILWPVLHLTYFHDIFLPLYTYLQFVFDRTNIICSYYWNGHHHCRAKWWAIPCVTDNCWWAGNRPALCYTTIYLLPNTCQVLFKQ